ncbi:glycoside hydrolase family 114 protein [Atractiella rhizophila]|nr:glycoside hydrolase family 114 protein [Atractiella rhizophila]
MTSFIISLLASFVLSTVHAKVGQLFPIDGKFDYQIGGAYTPSSDVKIVSRDNAENPVKGLYNICYINAFQSQPGDEKWWKTNHPDLLLKKKNGAYFEDEDWPGEFFLDTTTAAKRSALFAIQKELIQGCADKGFDAIEPDNLDTFTRSNKLLTKANNIAFSKLLADFAHSLGLAYAQKNTQISASDKKTVGFDFAIAEECQQWEECDSYTDLYGEYVIEIEYSDSSDGIAAYKTACKARGGKSPVILRDRDVVAKGKKNYRYEAC